MDEKYSNTNQHEITCPACGGTLTYAAGTTNLKCEYCGTKIEIDQSADEEIKELDFDEYINKNIGTLETQTIHTVRCKSCGARFSFDKNIISDRCPFCSSTMVVTDTNSETQIKPGLILPFSVEQNKGYDLFKQWLKSIWFAPNDLTKKINSPDTLKGLYIPYWTYDANTHTQYKGERGDDYEQSTDSKGNTQKRQLNNTRWSPVTGNLVKSFDDVLALASKSIPTNLANGVEPWDLENAVPYNEKYLSGYQTETYQIDLKTGFSIAKKQMENEIEDDIKDEIGGDHQKIISKKTEYSNITFKHALLPIYISAFKYNDKVYRFLINGRNGEVYGERPYSIPKIIFASILILFISYIFYKLSE